MAAPSPCKITVACVTDEAYVDGAVVMLASAAARLGSDCQLEVFVVDCGIAPATRLKLAGCLQAEHPNCQISFLPFDPAVLDGYSPTSNAHVTKATYAKLFLPRLLPNRDRCLYLDCDLFVDADLAELFSLDLDGHHIAAVFDPGRPTLADYEIESYLPDGTDLHGRAFNAGVMLLDLARMRELPCFQQPEILAGKKVACADQALFNLVFAGDWLELPSRWNRQVALWPEFSVYRDAPDQIWHIFKQNKPWHFRPVRPRGLVGDYYRSARRIRWSPLTRPHLSSRSSVLRDLVKWSRASLRRRLHKP